MKKKWLRNSSNFAAARRLLTEMIVLDANILIRAVMGRRVRQLGIRFCAPDVAYADAERYLPPLLRKRGKSDADVPESLNYLRHLVEPIGPEFYGVFEEQA